MGAVTGGTSRGRGGCAHARPAAAAAAAGRSTLVCHAAARAGRGRPQLASAGPEGPAGAAGARAAPAAPAGRDRRPAARVRLLGPRQLAARAKKGARRCRPALRVLWPPGDAACLSRRMRPSPPPGGFASPPFGRPAGRSTAVLFRPCFSPPPPTPTTRPARPESDAHPSPAAMRGPRAAFAQAVRAAPAPAPSGRPGVDPRHWGFARRPAAQGRRRTGSRTA